MTGTQTADRAGGTAPAAPTRAVVGMNLQRRGGAARRRSPLLTTALLALLVAALVASITLGSKAIGAGDIIQVLMGHGEGVADRGIIEARLARTAVGLLVGAALAVAGAAMQPSRPCSSTPSPASPGAA